MPAVGALSDKQLAEIDRRDLIQAAWNGAPLALLVVTMLHFYDVEWATDCLRKCGKLPRREDFTPP